MKFKIKRPLSAKAIAAKIARDQRITPVPNGVYMSPSPYRLQFELLGLPPNANASGGSRNFWSVKKERDMWIDAVHGLIATHLPPKPLSKAKLQLVRFSSVQPDPDGLVGGFKAVVDALVGKVIENDKHRNIGMPDYQYRQVAPLAGKIRIVVEEVA